MIGLYLDELANAVMNWFDKPIEEYFAWICVELGKKFDVNLASKSVP